MNNYSWKSDSERGKLRYLRLKSNITWYAIESCVSDFDKIGLNQMEIDCIKDRTQTYLNYFKEFNLNQKDNFPSFYLQQ
jgi:hypothetical protein